MIFMVKIYSASLMKNLLEVVMIVMKLLEVMMILMKTMNGGKQ